MSKNIALVTVALVVPYMELANATAVLQHNHLVYGNKTISDVPGVYEAKTLNAGETVLVYAKAKVENSSLANMLYGLAIQCGDEPEMWSTTNHEGYDSYTNNGGGLSQAVRYLFTAPSAGDFTCKMQAISGKSAHASEADYLTFLHGETNTLINVSRVGSGSASWGSENDKNYNTIEENSRVITYIGPGLKLGTQSYALRSARWVSAPGAVSISAIGDVEITVCYAESGSCAEGYRGDASIKDAGSVIRTRLIVQQMPSDGSFTPCAITYIPASGYKETTISSDTHHQKIHHTSESIPFSPSCGSSRSFISKMEIKWVSGNPIKVEPGFYSVNMLINNM